MKTKNFLLAIITLLSFTLSAQDNKEKKNKTEKEAFITIDVEGEERKNIPRFSVFFFSFIHCLLLKAVLSQ